MRSKPMIVVTCDWCGAAIGIDIDGVDDWYMYVHEEMEKRGWGSIGGWGSSIEGKELCPHCLELFHAGRRRP